MTKPKTHRRSVSMTAQTYIRLGRLAESKGTSRAAIVDDLIADAFFDANLPDVGKQRAVRLVLNNAAENAEARDRDAVDDTPPQVMSL